MIRGSTASPFHKIALTTVDRVITVIAGEARRGTGVVAHESLASTEVAGISEGKITAIVPAKVIKTIKRTSMLMK